MAKKWSNLNLAGALHFVTGNCVNRFPIFLESGCCHAFLKELKTINEQWPSKLIAYVIMPDHFHLISNPKDRRIIEFMRDFKSQAAKAVIQTTNHFKFPETNEGHQV